VGTRGDRRHAVGGGNPRRCRMSTEAVSWALRDAPDVPAQCVAVLVGLAEHADKHGRGAYPSAGTLAGYARKSKRQVHYDMEALAEAKLIRFGDQSLAATYPVNRRPVVYDLAVERVQPRMQPASPQDGLGMQSTSPLGVQPASPQGAAVQSTSPQDADDLQEQPGMQPTALQEKEFQGCNAVHPGVQPIANKPPTKPKSKPSSRRRNLNDGRADVERLCIHLADRVEAHGSLRPEIGKKWRDAARLMLDNDKRTEAQVHKAIDWCQDDGFWRRNVMSMPKLREKYDRLRLQAKEEQDQDAASGHPSANGRRQQRPPARPGDARNSWMDDRR